MFNVDEDKPYSELDSCIICGEEKFKSQEALWSDLIDTWELTPYEVGYVNRQQATCCENCGANMRSMVLAKAIVRHFRYNGSFARFWRTQELYKHWVLEINKASHLHQYLKTLPQYKFGTYPNLDMMNIRFPDNRFHMVVHTDTLEHVPDPHKALMECKRVLKPGGVLFFTIPIIVDRVSRSRKGLPPSYHGSGENREDYLVHTEYGFDMWKSLILAGFDNVTITTLAYPQAIALSAVKER